MYQVIRHKQWLLLFQLQILTNYYYLLLIQLQHKRLLMLRLTFTFSLFLSLNLSMRLNYVEKILKISYYLFVINNLLSHWLIIIFFVCILVEFYKKVVENLSHKSQYTTSPSISSMSPISSGSTASQIATRSSRLAAQTASARPASRAPQTSLAERTTQPLMTPTRQLWLNLSLLGSTTGLCWTL